MDSICLKAGINGMASPISVAGGGVDVRVNPTHIAAASAVGRSTPATVWNSLSVEKPPISVPSNRTTAPWGFSFKYPLRSLWSGGRNKYDDIAVEEAVLVEEKEEKREGTNGDLSDVGESLHGKNENWVLKILHVRSLWKEEEKAAQDESAEDRGKHNDEVNSNEQSGECSSRDVTEECDGCKVDDDETDKLEFDRDSFSKLLRRVSLTEAKMYAQMLYLSNLAYSISQIKPGNLLKFHGLRFVTSSLEQKERALKAEKEKSSTECQGVEGNLNEPVEGMEDKTSCNRISASIAYQVVASAASYLQSQTKSILPFKSSTTNANDDFPRRDGGGTDNVDKMNADMASFMATTDSVTAVVAAKEEVKQAVADDLKSTHLSPCEWFICDYDQSSTRFFVIQGSESLASWQANLLFEPIQFEGLDVLVHRGIYEAAKGIYEQMLAEVRARLKSHGDRATFRFTGHSLGGSLSLLVNLMLLIRGEVPSSSLLPVITFGAPSIMCGGDHLLHELGLPRSHVQAITMHRDIVPRAFSCNYPNRIAELLKALNGNFRSHPCLNRQRLLYTPMGEFLILQPDEKFSPSHHLLPSGSGLYLLDRPLSDASEAEKQVQAAQAVFFNSPHPLEILSDRSAYGAGGTIQRDHDVNSYLKSIRSVIRQELRHMKKAKREHRRRVWWPLVAPWGISAGGIIVGRPVASGNMDQGQLNFSGILQTGRDSMKRFSRFVASRHMHLLVVVLFPARWLIVGACTMIRFR